MSVKKEGKKRSLHMDELVLECSFRLMPRRKCVRQR